MGYIAAELHAGFEMDRLDKSNALIVAAVATSVFYRFTQLTSYRTMKYMVVRASVQWARVVTIIVVLAYLLLPEHNWPMARHAMQFWAFGTLPFLLLTLTGLRLLATQIYGSDQTRRAIFIMPGRQSCILNTRLGRSPNLGIEVQGYFGHACHEDITNIQRIGGVEDAVEYLRTQPINVVFVGTDVLNTGHTTAIMDQLSDSTAAVYFVPEIDPRSPFQIDIASIASVPVLALHETNVLGVSRLVKRGMDLVLASLALVSFAIPMLAIAWAVRQSSPGPVIFRQIRYGQDGRPIVMLKFRSMYMHPLEPGIVRQAVRGDARVTPIGHFIRRTSLDELPQLINVLNGSMSLVGPRPHAMEHNELYRQQIKGYMLRHSVKPGITGWAQVNNLRGETDTLDKMVKRVEFDRYYIKNWSIGLDLRILARTVLLMVLDRKSS